MIVTLLRRCRRKPSMGGRRENVSSCPQTNQHWANQHSLFGRKKTNQKESQRNRPLLPWFPREKPLPQSETTQHQKKRGTVCIKRPQVPLRNRTPIARTAYFAALYALPRLCQEGNKKFLKFRQRSVRPNLPFVKHEIRRRSIFFDVTIQWQVGKGAFADKHFVLFVGAYEFIRLFPLFLQYPFGG